MSRKSWSTFSIRAYSNSLNLSDSFSITWIGKRSSGRAASQADRKWASAAVAAGGAAGDRPAVPGAAVAAAVAAGAAVDRPAAPGAAVAAAVAAGAAAEIAA